VAVGPGREGDRQAASTPYVSPLRADAASAEPVAAGVSSAEGSILPRIPPAEPIPTYVEPAGASWPAAADHEEPALPDEARAREAATAVSATVPTEAAPNQVLHVRFAGAAPDRLVSAMETLRGLLHERPGTTRVVLHLPGQGGDALPMELRRGVAYDAELVSDVRRRFGDGLVELSLS
jgi:hypothetical protein